MQIRLKSLKVRHGLTWKELFLRLENRGLVLVQGKNGTGKSNIPELLSLIFYNQSEKSGKNNDVISRTVGKDFMGMVELERQEGDEWVPYVVMCCRKVPGEPTGIRIWRGEEEEPITPVKKPVQAQKMASDLLGMSYAEFRAVVSLGSESIHPLIDGTDASRTDYVSQTFDLEYGEYHDAAQKRLKAIRGLMEEHKENEVRLKLLREDLRNLKPVDYSELKRKKSARDAVRKKVDKADRLVVNLVKLLAEQRTRQNIQMTLAQGKEKESLEVLRARQTKIRDKMDQIDDKLDIHDSYYAHKKRHEKAVVDLKEALSEVSSHDEKKCRARVKVTRKNLAEVEAEISLMERLEGQDTCPTCEQGLDHIHQGNYESRLAILTKRSRIYQKKIETLEDILEVFDEARGLREVVREAKAALPSRPPGVLERLEREKDVLYEKDTALHNRIVRAKKNAEQEKKLQGLAKGDPRKTQVELKQWKARLEKCRRKERVLTEEVEKVRAHIQKEARIKESIERVEGLVEKGKPIAEELEIFEGLVSAFGRQGLRRDRVREILALIAEHLDHYANTLLPRYTFSLVDNEKKTAFMCHDKVEGVNSDVRVLSKGEKKRLSIALLLTERDIRRVKTNLLFLDEFDGGLDRPEELVEVLADLKSEYETIFAITHTPAIKSFEGFDREYTVSRPEVFSQIKRRKR